MLKLKVSPDILAFFLTQSIAYLQSLIKKY